MLFLARAAGLATLAAAMPAAAMTAAAMPATPAAKCEKGKHGPPCSVDANCSAVPACVRCAHSGFCTIMPLPGPPGPPGPHPRPGPHPTPTPSPNAPFGAAGDYDLLVYARFWMGEPAKDIKCSAYATSGLTLHGIWPQYSAARSGHEWPQFCNATHDEVLPLVSAKFAAQWKQFAPAYGASSLPFAGLAAHEWQRHGTCWSAAIDSIAAGDNKALPALEEKFFQASLDLNKRYPTPAIMGTSRAAGQPIALADLQKAFGGPTGSVALSCKGSQLSMVSLCFSKDLSARVACPASTLASSYDNGCAVNGVKQVAVAFKCAA